MRRTLPSGCGSVAKCWAPLPLQSHCRMSAPGDSDQAGANVEQVSCDNATRWRIESVGLDHVRVVHDGTDVCLDVAGGSTEMGANVQQWTCNDLAPQIWRAEP